MGRATERLEEIYADLYQYFGPQQWWPADTPFEIIVGAVLTQNTNWQNVEKSINTLRDAGLLSFEELVSLPEKDLAQLIRSSGYYNLKARRLKNLLCMIAERYDGDFGQLFSEPFEKARQCLLEVKGIGPETADSILLYAGGKPVFVVDAYTHRIFSRHGLVPEESDYDSIQELFMDNLPHDTGMFNEYHALIVKTAKEFCRKNNPRCSQCPLNEG